MNKTVAEALDLVRDLKTELATIEELDIAVSRRSLNQDLHLAIQEGDLVNGGASWATDVIVAERNGIRHILRKE